MGPKMERLEKEIRAYERFWGFKRENLAKGFGKMAVGAMVAGYGGGSEDTITRQAGEWGHDLALVTMATGAYIAYRGFRQARVGQWEKPRFLQREKQPRSERKDTE